ncbi:Transcriptional regulator, GntR family [Caballeronia glathei]|jgi:DNA-binding GntR family transcriptional regulator|uniref:GntR family transcriptional regulator n=1 Tax=Caballeronia glathei TaxID=60547 RepID=A0A069Q3E8_9BURK|nr:MULTISPECIES: GntR family transcriptional regulator [Burkholderiaceae]KDR44316.1 GntR family transcriptional regulator [Caballeronia glathei]TCK34523.1 GntR family transcriptional regulator [Paraburkholderia sp. BL8N3]CDY77603.1 Transcriptional regulator, GntR family [Caballeronia glathei]
MNDTLTDPVVAPASPGVANPLAEQVYQKLKSDIFSFRLFPGDRFSESGIAHHYGVSRTPMRDGLFRLQREGYLEVGFRRGWKVAQINFDQLDQLYDLRIVLEAAAVERLATGGDRSHAVLEALKATWCVPPALRECDPVAMFGMDEDFHRQLVAATSNAEMLRVHNEVTERIRIVRRLDFLKPHRTDATYDEHATMLHLIERGRLTEANILLRAHVTQSKLEVRKITLSMLAEARDSKLPFVS